MQIIKDASEGLITIHPSVFSDERGYFLESFNENDFNQFVFEQAEESEVRNPSMYTDLQDDLKEMIEQATEIASWGRNVNVKIPITNSKGVETTQVVRELSSQGVALNITAILTVKRAKIPLTH